MSPKNKKKLNLLRKKLDYLDNDLLKLIKIRLNIVNKVLKLKSYKKEIVDKKRITSILKKVRKKSIQKKIDSKITKRIWLNMIWSFVNYERRKFKKK